MPWIQPNGMLAYWRAEGDTSDSAGNYDGTAVGSVTYSDGQVSQAFNLPGSGPTYVDTGFIPGTVIGDGNAFTIEAWFKLDSASGNCIIGGITSDFNNRTLIQVLSDRKIDVGIGNISGTTMGTLVASLNQWHYVAMICDGSSTIKVFLDTTSQSASLTDDSYCPIPLYIGSLNQGTPGKLFDGQIDEVAIYDRVLSDEEAANHYNNGLRGYPFGYALINGFDQSSVGTDELVTSSIDRSGLVSAIQTSESDTYFDSTDELSSVRVNYTHEDGRQRTRILHTGAGLSTEISWSGYAQDGTWKKDEVIAFDANGAKRTLDRTAIGAYEDIILSDGTMSLNTI